MKECLQNTQGFYLIWTAAGGSSRRTRFCRKFCRIRAGRRQTDGGEGAFGGAKKVRGIKEASERPSEMPAAGGRAAQNGKGNREKDEQRNGTEEAGEKAGEKTGGENGGRAAEGFPPAAGAGSGAADVDPGAAGAGSGAADVDPRRSRRRSGCSRRRSRRGGRRSGCCRCWEGTGLGGAESRVMDSYRHLDRSRIQFDFCVHTQEEGFFDKEIESLGGHIYRVPRFRAVNWLNTGRRGRTFSGCTRSRGVRSMRRYMDI